MKKQWIWIILIVLSGVIIWLATQFKIVRVTDASMLPIIEKGEKLFIKNQDASKLHHNQIIAYYDPSISDVIIKHKPIKISRLIAFPGDTIQIKEKSIYVNGEAIDIVSPVFMKYRISVKKGFNPETLKSVHHFDFKEIVNGIAFEMHCTPETAAGIARMEKVTAVHLLWDLRGKASFDIFPVSQYIAWNKDYFGPFVIPKKDAITALTFRNYDLYKRIIDVYEENISYSKAQKVYIQEEVVNSYQFTQNYYFVVNDNRDYPKDSRTIGVIPASHIIGGK